MPFSRKSAIKTDERHLPGIRIEDRLSLEKTYCQMTDRIKNPNGSVLILDGQWRNTLSVVRSLGRRGIKIDVGEDTPLALCSFSRYAKRHFVYPSVKSDPEKFKKILLDRIRKTKYDMVIPITDAMVSFISDNRDEISKYACIPFVDNETLQFALDKEKVLDFAGKIGIPAPQSYLPSEYADPDELIGRLNYPVVLKPKSSYGSRGLAYVKNQDEFRIMYNQVKINYGKPLIQEQIPSEGKGVGVSLLYDFHHEMKAFFTHVRLREFPVSGGPSTLRESIWYPELVRTADRLMRSLHWVGIAMVEFKMDPRDGIPKLMEINPRFWGSLELAVQSGVDFPWLLYRLYLDGSVRKVRRYRVGYKCRWLLPGDMLHFLANPKRFKLKPSFFRFFDKNTGYDIFSKDDPLPVLSRIFYILTHLFSGETWKFVWRR
jgi:predicted ATP-grasp superfamily ATP-dependent carboligase